MANLIYTAITSLDGYIADESGNFDWAAPDPEVHAVANEIDRAIGLHLYGKHMYEVMKYWETALEAPDLPAVEQEYARIWQAADKIVYSSTLKEVSSARTRIESEFDPEAIRQLVATAEKDVGIGGAELASHAFREGLVHQIHLFLNPIIVGGGKPSLTRDVRLNLELLAERRFTNGVVYLHYRVLA